MGKSKLRFAPLVGDDPGDTAGRFFGDLLGRDITTPVSRPGADVSSALQAPRKAAAAGAKSPGADVSSALQAPRKELQVQKVLRHESGIADSRG